MDKVCKDCGKKLGETYSEVEEDGELVVVDEQIHQTIVLNKGDLLCMGCYQVLTFYRRIK